MVSVVPHPKCAWLMFPHILATYPMLVQFHGEIPVKHPTARVITGAQVLPETQVPKLLDLESLWVWIPPELKNGL